MSNLILVGFMGAGKTTVGKILANDLNYDFFDIDSVICENTKMTIPEIFERFGQEWFRKQETFALECITDGDNRVISTGGGIVESKDNFELLKKGGKVIYLKSTPDKLWTRISKGTDRPLATDLSSFRKLFEKRKPCYEEVCDFSVDTDRKTPQEIADEINLMGKEGKSE